MPIKQIILITDGESNVGASPIVVAKRAKENDIVVNTIGIVKNKDREEPLREVEEIALNGGGICEITSLESLDEVLSMVTVQSIHKTIEEVVNKELREIIDKDIKEIPPKERKKIVEMMDKLGDEVSIKCLILLDTSGSMKYKINVAKRSVLELFRFLKERSGQIAIGIITYPGEEDFYNILCDFTDDVNYLEEKMKKISIGGTTPTGPALEGGIDMILGKEKNVFSEYMV
ncbi:MAG: Ca-activated chloride channel family protein [Sporanaerobacter sp.]|uniref:vWA domain-containing protein n=1 Tax=Sporanaerobacter sp. TaxID=2010183 RepID=UPI003A0FE1DE